jgi:hypothetical protein
MPGSPMPSLIKERDPVVGEIYGKLIQELKRIGPFNVEEKKTSLHLSRESAFAGIHPRAKALLLNIRHAAPIESGRFRKVEQVSKNRFHSEVLLETAEDVDAELLSWLQGAYHLCGE